MRDDMDRLLVTRPRWGSRHPQRGLRRRRRERVCPEEAPRREGMRGRHRSKWSSEYFAPLLRFLRKRVGCPWNDVYSEIRRAVPADGVVQQHIYVHLRDFVANPVFERDGRLYTNREWGGVVELGLYPDPDTFYVCPRTGRLRELPWRRPRRDIVNPDIRIAGPDRQLHRLAGVWFEVQLRPLPEDLAGRRSAFDRVLRVRPFELEDEQRRVALAWCYGTGVRYGAVRRTLSRKELRGLEKLPCASWPVARRGSAR